MRPPSKTSVRIIYGEASDKLDLLHRAFFRYSVGFFSPAILLILLCLHISPSLLSLSGEGSGTGKVFISKALL